MSVPALIIPVDNIPVDITIKHDFDPVDDDNIDTIDELKPLVFDDPLWNVLALLHWAHVLFQAIPANRLPPAANNQEIAGLLLEQTMDYVTHAMIPATWPELEDSEPDCSETHPAGRQT
jgi:hypothetical protein